MTVTQVAPFVNAATKEILGEGVVTTEDLSNIVDLGREISNLDNWQAKILKNLVDRIGKAMFVDRPYSGHFPSLYMDSFQYGSIVAKYDSELPEASTNYSWELQDGVSYGQDTYHGIDATMKVWNKMVTHEVVRSIPDHQLNEAFSSASEAAKFWSMVQTYNNNALNLQNEALIHAVVNRAIANIINNGSTGVNKINLLSEYNTNASASLTAITALQNAEFIRYAVKRIQMTSDFMTSYSTLFNTASKSRHTPKDRQKFIMLSEFANAIGVYLYNAPNQFANNYLSLPSADVVPFWQGSGTGFAFADTSKVMLTDNSDPNDPTSLSQSGIVAIIADEWSMGICNERQFVTAQYNNAAQFTNYWYKREARYFNDANENMVVFYVA